MIDSLPLATEKGSKASTFAIKYKLMTS